MVSPRATTQTTATFGITTTRVTVEVQINVWQWIAVVAGGWLVLAAIVGLIVGRVIRNRDRQDPGVQNVPTAEETKTRPLPGAAVLYLSPRAQKRAQQGP